MFLTSNPFDKGNNYVVIFMVGLIIYVPNVPERTLMGIDGFGNTAAIITISATMYHSQFPP